MKYIIVHRSQYEPILINLDIIQTISEYKGKARIVLNSSVIGMVDTTESFNQLLTLIDRANV